MIFEDPKGNKVEIKSIRNHISKLIGQYPEDFFKIIIGTDSQQKGNKLTFVTVIVIYRIGKGGTYYLRTQKRLEPVPLREKIYIETKMSLDTADTLKTNSMEGYVKGNLEIHVDVGQNGETKILIKEIIKYMEDRGYKILIKPNSFAASKVADRHTK
ncbi:ribonuclease H-like YkuK family protein [Alkalicella caledoniensis]|uniref:Ribonuclease H-like YkuK family protein n=1 Tax=Alkalicella caledoniensis TaxID=2731377 RepID=A0A7G9W880_ALKCA|nr:ribonuclease H-like YkuK family protein [Alkalicella caledoniensis]QNO14892.1 ribonuclease H-like YkuK family protein [Alkalicella caledoniensis]